MSSDPIYHMIIENYYGLAGGHPYKQLEYPIPNKPLRIPDMFNSKTGDVYEIEPIYLKSQGKIQVKDYVYDLAAAGEVGLLEGTYGFFKYNWNKTPFHIGTGIDWPGKYQSIFLYNPLFDLVADYVGDGVVVYWLEPDALAWTYTAKELRDIARNQKLFRRRNFYPSSPAYQPAYIIDYNNLCGQALIIVGGVIIAVTIVEDATAVGIVDDIVTIPAGYYLINYGMKLAYFYPAP
ncbi:MAG: hypothetical protein GYA34_11015 [Chloroflexi bacterium]|nr:hypothetical protein [Chloroflexota bacterium]